MLFRAMDTTWLLSSAHNVGMLPTTMRATLITCALAGTMSIGLALEAAERIWNIKINMDLEISNVHLRWQLRLLKCNNKCICWLLAFINKYPFNRSHRLVCKLQFYVVVTEAGQVSTPYHQRLLFRVRCGVTLIGTLAMVVDLSRLSEWDLLATSTR
jgi:hypothetical protein